MQNLKTKKRVFIKKKWGSPKKKGAPLSNKKPGLMVRFFVAHNHPSSFVTESVVPVTTEVRRGAFVTDCGFPVTTEVRWVRWGVLGCAEGCQERNIPARGDLAGILCYLPALCAG